MNTFSENDNLFWELEEGVLSITGKGKIPDYYVGKNPAAPWDDIADQILELEIENGVTEIGVCAFSKCKNLNLIVLPQSLVRIHFGAFEGCSSLEDVLYDPDMSFVHMYEKTEKNLKRSRSIHEKEKSQQIISFGLRAFTGTPWAIETWGDYYVSANVLIDVLKESENVVIPERVEEIGTMAFQNMNVKTVQFPEVLKVIDNFAFQNTKLTSVTIPQSVKRIGYGAFAQTGVEYALFEGSNMAEINPSAFDETSVSFDDKNLYIYEMKSEAYPASQMEKLGVKMKEMKTRGRKKEGIIGYESADICGGIMKMIQAGQAVIGITCDDWNKKIIAVETVAWNKRDKKPIYMKFSPQDILDHTAAGAAENDMGASRLSKNDMISMFPGTDAKGMVKAGSIVAPQPRSHQEWFASRDRKNIFGNQEFSLLSAWMEKNPDYTI